LTRAVPVDRVVNIQTAIGDRCGQATLIRHRAPDTNSLLPFEAQAVAEAPHLFSRVGDVQVPITTLDAFCQAHGIDVIDYLHVDTQGYEARLIQGASQLLAAKRIDVLLVEVLFSPLYAGQPTYLEICSELARHEYRLVCLQGLFFEPGRRAPRSGNIIFVRDEGPGLP
jgi:FkbM family methyltransferase